MELIETLLKRSIVTVISSSFDVSSFNIIGNTLSIKKTKKYDSQITIYDTINTIKQSPEVSIGVKS
jgi:hypothetical protein